MIVEINEYGWMSMFGVEDFDDLTYEDFQKCLGPLDIEKLRKDLEFEKILEEIPIRND